MREVLGRNLGPVKNEGNEMTMWILKMNGRIVPRTGLWKLTPGELHSEVEISKQNTFEANVHSKLGNSFTLPPSPTTVQEDVEEERTHDPDDEESIPDVILDALQ